MNHHDYLSTACWHLRGTECRRACKFCPNECICLCHVDGNGCRHPLSEEPVYPGGGLAFTELQPAAGDADA